MHMMPMKSLLKSLFPVITILLLLSSTVSAQVRIGYLDPQQILDNLPEKEAIERQMNRFLDQREAEFEERAMAFQNALGRFENEAPSLSDAEIRRRQEELQIMDRELQEFQFRVQQELEQRQSELLGPILQEMNRIIEEIATEKNLDYVLNTASAEGEQFLLFISDEVRADLDLTDRILTRMLQ